MNYKSNNLINVPKGTKEVVTTNSTNETFFKESDVSELSSEGNQKAVNATNELLDSVRKLQPITLWDLSKKTGVPRTTLFYKIRDLEFANLIYSKIIVNSKNRTVRMIFSRRPKNG